MFIKNIQHFLNLIILFPLPQIAKRVAFFEQQLPSLACKGAAG